MAEPYTDPNDPNAPITDPSAEEPVGLVDEGGLPSETTTQPDVVSGNDFVTPEATVSGQLSQILEAGSPLQTLAEQRSKAAAQRTGLLSSSMAVGAGQQALYDSALKVATPDAATYARAGLTEQQATNQLAQTGFEGDISSRLTAQQGNIDTALQAADIKSREGMLDTEIEGQKTIETMKNDAAWLRTVANNESAEGIAADRITASMEELVTQLGMDKAMFDSELGQQLVIENAKLDVAQKEFFQTNVKDIYANMNRDIAGIQGNPDITGPNKTRMIEQAEEAARAEIDLMASISGQTVDWIGMSGSISDGSGTGTGTTPTPTPTPAPTPAAPVTTGIETPAEAVAGLSPNDSWAVTQANADLDPDYVPAATFSGTPQAEQPPVNVGGVNMVWDEGLQSYQPTGQYGTPDPTAGMSPGNRMIAMTAANSDPYDNGA